jgi:hypothetical protein
VIEALKSTSGAEENHQHAIIKLESLDRVLKAIATLRLSESNLNHVNAIRAMALACQLPLRQFLERFQKYKSSLGSFAMRRSLPSMVSKLKWAFIMAEQVKGLRAVVASKDICINLMLNLHTS